MLLRLFFLERVCVAGQILQIYYITLWQINYMVFYTDIDKSDNTFRFSQGSVDHAYYGAILRCNRSFAASYGDGLSVWRRFYEYDNTYFRRTDGALGIARIPYEIWVKWFWKLLLLFILLGLVLLVPTVLFPLNGF